jgi:site-specific recombinase XerD
VPSAQGGRASGRAADRRTAQLTAAWLATKTSDNTRAAYERDLAGFVAWCRERDREPLEADSRDAHDYRDACLAAGASAATVTRRLSGIASFFRYAEQHQKLAANPFDDVARPAHERPDRTVLDDAELSALLESARSLGAKAVALVALLALDGMKLGEVLAVDVPRVRLDGAAATVELERRGRREAVAVTPETAAAVAAYVGRRRRGPLFLGDSPVPASPSRLTRFGADFVLKRAGVAAGLRQGVSASMLRRSYIAAARRAGTPLADIAHHVGHREVRETERLLD